jgi:hypothetical protein
MKTGMGRGVTVICLCDLCARFVVFGIHGMLFILLVTFGLRRLPVLQTFPRWIYFKEYNGIVCCFCCLVCFL